MKRIENKACELIKSVAQINTMIMKHVNWGDKYGHYFLCIIIGVIILFVFKDFLLLKKTYLFKDIASDSINVFYPAYYSMADYFAKEGIPRWLFNQGMGQNIFPSHWDPFSLYVILMGKANVYYTIFYAEVFKIFFAGLLFYLFIKKIGISNYAAIIGGVLYAFSGFMILGGEWNVFSTQGVYVALLLYSFEKFYQDNNWLLFPTAVFLIAANQPLDLFFMGSFLLVYIVFRWVEAGKQNRRECAVLIIKLIFLGIIGTAMSSFFFINGIQLMLDSPRGSGEVSYLSMLMATPILGIEGHQYGGTHYLTALMRFFSCDILGTGNNFRGWYNYLEAPLFYCGLIPLVLLLHFGVLPDRRKKITYFVFFLIVMIPVIFPFFRYAFWLFTGNYYRIYSLFVAIVVLLIGLKVLGHINGKTKVNFLITLAVMALLGLLLYYPYSDNRIIDSDIRRMVLIFCAVYSVLVYLIQYEKISLIIKVTLAMVVVVELILFSSVIIKDRPVILGEETVRKTGYNDYTVDAIQYLKSEDKSFFRVNKDYYSGPSMHMSLNDAKAQEFYGTPSYHSFNQLNYIKFLQELNIINKQDEAQTRWVWGLMSYPALHSFASVKYTLSKNKMLNKNQVGYEPMAVIGDVTIMKNNLSLPLGFTYEKFIPFSEFHQLSRHQKMMTLYKAVVIDQAFEGMERFEKINTADMNANYTAMEYLEDIGKLSKETLHINQHRQNELVGKIRLEQDKILFLSIPYDKGWKAEIDGQEVPLKKVNIGFIGLPLTRGEHTVKVSFTPLYFHLGAFLSLVFLILFIVVLLLKYVFEKKTRLASHDY